MAVQVGFSELEYAATKKPTWRDRYLSHAEVIAPWAKLVAVIGPPYPTGKRCGRPLMSVQRMLHTYTSPQCLGLSSERIEDAVCDSQANCRFADIDLTRKTAPEAATRLKFGQLLNVAQNLHDQHKTRYWGLDKTSREAYYFARNGQFGTGVHMVVGAVLAECIPKGRMRRKIPSKETCFIRNQLKPGHFRTKSEQTRIGPP